MDTYTKVSYATSKLFTTAYSTSFGLSIRLFKPSLRPHIYAIYGFVRIADEIVDSYTGSDRREILDDLEAQTKVALKTGYSSNPVVQAFIVTARQFNITKDLIAPFFNSMRMDSTTQKFDQKLYENYIYGSAEVVGLMCLKVFTADEVAYQKLEAGAKRLGAAYQKVNFLRDIASDANTLNRWYFPIASFETFDDAAKNSIITDIKKDFTAAEKAIAQLPSSSRPAVLLSYQYYSKLLKEIEQTPASLLLKKRIRVSDIQKTVLFIHSLVRKNHA